MSRSNRRTICLILVLALILSTSATVFAAAPPQTATPQGDIGIQSIADVLIEFWRTGSTSASSNVSATTYDIAEYIKSSVTLQKYNTSTKTWSNVGSPKVTTVYNTAVIYTSNNWTLETNTTYRLKAEITDKTGSVTTTVTAYSASI